MKSVIPALAATSCIVIALSALPAAAVPAEQVPAPRTHITIGPLTIAGPTATPNPKTRVTFLAGLQRNSAGLADRARVVSTPGSWSFRHFVMLKDAGKAFGASSAAVRALKDAAGPLGISVSVDRTRLFARLTATVASWEKVYGTPVVYAPAPHSSSGAEDGPQPNATYLFMESEDFMAGVPASLSPYVEELVPFAAVYDVEQDIPGPVPMEQRSILPIDGQNPKPWPINTGSPVGPSCLAGQAVASAVFTPAQTRDAYGTSAVVEAGARGRAARVTIISLGGGFSTADLAGYATCFGVRAPDVKVRLALGIPHEIVSFSPETHLDLQTVTGVLGDASRIDLVQAVNDAFNAGTTDAFARALDRNGKGTRSPDVVSLSYGGCELNVTEDVQAGVKGSPLVPVLEDVFAMAGLVGTSLFVASGDFGSSMCQKSNAPLLSRPTISYPAASPWVTAVGGTRLALGADNVRTREIVWNDVRYGLQGAGTGGTSVQFRAPWYQRGVLAHDRRTVPDVAALAALRPGWPLAYGEELVPIGGTSGASPFTAANIALISARERQQGRAGIGFANPWLYSRGGSAFYDVTIGDNQIAIVDPGEYVNTPACCAATRGYDLASGLGAPRFDRLLALAGG